MGRHVEIERKFLLASRPPGMERHRAVRIVQGYLPVRSKVLEMRVRRTAKDHGLTIKIGGGLARREDELKLSLAQFRALWPFTLGRRISKRRYRLPHGKHTIEVDVHAGRHAGLMTAEIEFNSHPSSRAFVAPDWMKREITGERRYTNRMLAGGARHRA